MLDLFCKSQTHIVVGASSPAGLVLLQQLLNDKHNHKCCDSIVALVVEDSQKAEIKKLYSDRVEVIVVETDIKALMSLKKRSKKKRVYVLENMHDLSHQVPMDEVTCYLKKGEWFHVRSRKVSTAR